MIVTLIGNQNINTITLPEKVKGQFWLYDSDAWNANKIVSIEALNGKWIMKSNRRTQIVNSSNETLKSIELNSSDIYVLNGQNNRLYVYSEPLSDNSQTFTKYLFRNDIVISIGRSEQNDIVYSNKLVSSKHATIVCKNGHWSVQDLSSTNGTFVNKKRCSDCYIKIGDIIFIMGLKIIVGKNFIAINNPNNSVRINSNNLLTFIPQEYVEDSDDIDEIDEETDDINYFSRNPRFKKDIKKAEIKIDSPPQSPLAQEMPWLLIMGSSLAMGMMSIVTLSSAIISGNTTSMFMGGSMLIGTVLIPTISKKYEKNLKKKKEAQRQKKYHEYLDSVALKINEECQKQEEIVRENFMGAQECANRIQNTTNNLWDRGAGQNDFLSFRLGIGDDNFEVELKYGERKFSIDEDNLQEEMLSLCESPRRLHNVPIRVSAYKDYILGVIGNKKSLFQLANNIIVQLAAYYSYDEIKFVFLYDEGDKEYLDYTRWLPHVWDDEKIVRFIATTYDEVKTLSSILERDIDNRIGRDDESPTEANPYYIVFSFSEHLARNAEFLRKILNEHRNINCSVINFRNEYRLRPKECSTVIELLEDSNGRVFDKNCTKEEIVTFVPDNVTNMPTDLLSKQLANTFLDAASKKYIMPKMITFLDMYNVGKIEHLNPLTRWLENDPTKTLQAPVGVDQTGHLFNLDLHEKFHGPHGLVAGMTGSGKSEFIITYILSMAINYHPNEVAFVLIDYKGGGLAGAFVDEESGIKLPHVVGTITNLDGASITRSLISLQSELRRRQGIFNEARKVSNEGTIDIYKYQKLYRKGLVTEPLPHLFVISDEFAELKTQQPEFMEQLISAARIGRSLGVHLILATQKPSGVVDDQIWSNSRFRVCLKVQDKADSMDMIKRPDAASLVETGRFYLQVGFNEFFDMGQSAWCGAPYIETEKIYKKYDNSIRVVDILGQTVAEVKPKEKNVTGEEPKQIVSLVKYLTKIAEEESIITRNLWLDPIPEKIFVGDIEDKYSHKTEKYVLNPVVGEYDDPFNQSQGALTLPISQEGHAIVYGSTGSGTETFIETLTYSLIKNHDAHELNVFVLDFGSETMGAFKKAPQIGDILYSSDEEKIINLFKVLKKEVGKRKKKFAEYGGTYASYIKNCDEKPANIVVIINNFAVFAEVFEDQEDELASITRESQKYGIYFVVTATASNSVRYRLQQNFKQLLVLQMNDTSDYVGILGQTNGVVPSKLYGRGIIKLDKVYEFQTALSSPEENIMEFYRNTSRKLSENSDYRSPGVPILPDIVNYEFIKENITDISSIPVGVNKNNLQINKINISNTVAYSILSNDIAGTSIFTTSLAIILNKLVERVVVIDSTGIIVDGEYELINDEIEDAVENLFNELVERNNTFKDNEKDPNSLNDYSETIYILLGLKDIFEQLTDDAVDKLKVLLEKAEIDYKIKFIIVDEASNVGSYSFNQWFKKQIATNEGIWVGSGLYEQYMLKLNRAQNYSDEIDNSLGYVVDKGNETLIKLIDLSEVEEVEYE